jgi:transcriptional regulator with XRE-family HTH domain
MRKQLVSPTQKTMAALIAEALNAQGLTQAELARQAGVSTKHVNLVLHGQAGAQLGQLDYWAWILGLRFEVKLVPLE